MVCGLHDDGLRMVEQLHLAGIPVIVEACRQAGLHPLRLENQDFPVVETVARREASPSRSRSRPVATWWRTPATPSCWSARRPTYALPGWSSNRDVGPGRVVLHVETIGTVGFGDFYFRDQHAWLRAWAIFLMVVGATLATVFFALLTNVLIGWPARCRAASTSATCARHRPWRYRISSGQHWG